MGMPASRTTPSRRSLLALEGVRAVGEQGLLAAAAPLLAASRRGDGHTVLVLPGLGGDDGTTSTLRRFLSGLGYDARGWGLGRNVPSAELARDLRRVLADAYDRRRAPVSLIGWSLGGIYAREAARRVPEGVRAVITLGSPFRDLTARRFAEQGRALPVPSTAVYSRTDGVVAWEACLDVEGPRS